MEQLGLIAARLAASEQPGDDLPDIAAAALARGLDSPALRTAAGVPRHEVREARDAFDEALAELGIPVPDEQRALWTLTLDTLARIDDGSLDAYEGAAWIWRSVYSRFELAGDVRVLVALASEWQDAPAHRSETEIAIRRAARTLLDRGSPRTWLRPQARAGASPITDSHSRTPCSIDELPVGDAIRSDLRAWARDFDSVQARPGRGPSGFVSVEAAQDFVDRGSQLAEAMQRELGDDWFVEYSPAQSSFPTPIGRAVC